MANATLNANWAAISDDLKQQFLAEFPTDQILLPKDRESAFQHLAATYVKYVQIFRKLEQLTELDVADFHSFEGVLLDLKLSIEDLEMPVPRFLVEEQVEKLRARNVQLTTLKAKTVGETGVRLSFPELSLEQAVQIIQISERGRQGRMRAKYMKDIRAQELREASFDNAEDDMEVASAALNIQRIWRGYKSRKEFQVMREQELVFLGMARPDAKTSNVLKTTLDANLARRKALQQQHEEEYQSALISIKEKLRKVEGPDIKEFYQDSFRQWYMDYKRVNNKFPDFPAIEEWSNPLFKFGEPLPGSEAASAQAKAAEESKKDAKGTGKAGSAKPSAKTPAKPAAKSGKGGKDKVLDKQYDAEWRHKDENGNYVQKHDVEIIRQEKRAEVDAEVKTELYNVLKEELDNLKLAMEKETKKGKKGKGGTGKKKKEKGAGGKKGKKEKDLTGGKPIEELVQELVEAGIMQQVVSESCVLPLALENADDNVKSARSVLLYGPAGVGKSLLVNGVVNDTGAAFFNLTPRNTAGQYTGKANVARMVYTVFKVAKALAPSVIFIDDAESVYAKKVPKEDTSDPKRIKKDLGKQINQLKPSMRVLVIGCSRRPFDCDMKGLTDAYNKQIYVSRPDYATRVRMWREWAEAEVGAEHRSALNQVNWGVLAKVSDGSTGEIIKGVVKRVLNSRRLGQLAKSSVQTKEFVTYLLMLPEPDKAVAMYGGDQEAEEAAAAAKGKGGKGNARASAKKK
ncbi:hypothetical protein RI367_000297 [Sorochytrium milnesiophthora]